MAIIYPKEMKRFEGMPYADVWTEHQVAMRTGSAMAAIAAVALKRKVEPQHLTIFGLLRDVLRKPRHRRFSPQGGHWACIRMKLEGQKPSLPRIAIYISLAALTATVLNFIYDTH